MKPFYVCLIRAGESARTLRVFAESQVEADAKALRSNEGWKLGVALRKQRRPRMSDRPTRSERIINSGYQAYAMEEGHYDQGDY